MTTGSTGAIGPGTLLADRYRLEDLLAESDGARFWRATDRILARSVAIHAVASDDSRAPALMEAARVSATVTDPHLLRVLDCDDRDGITWVVNEWGDGVSLDLMLQQGTLPPARAAWLAREVAEAVAAGHAQGVSHGRLNPEAVLVTHAGSVKLIGYVIDATLQRPQPPHPLYGELDEREADVINLAAILYAALTGRWPGVAPSAVPTAPWESRRPLRPRQVRAGVPRTLDAICERVLHKEGSRHALPVETALEVAAALSDYVGDPGLVAPGDVAGMHSEPTLGLAAGNAEDPETTYSANGSWPAEDADPAYDPEATQLSAAVGGAPDAAPPASTPSPAAAPSALAAPSAPSLEQETRIHREPLESPDDLQPMHRPTDPQEEVPPPPPFEEVPERPLFASTERRVPAAARAAQYDATGAGAAATGAGVAAGNGNGGGNGSPPALSTTGTNGFWPFTDEAEEKHGVHTGKEGRGWMRTAIVVAILLVLVVAMAVAFNRGRGGGTLGIGGDDGSSDSRNATQTQAPSRPLRVVAVRDFDPYGDPPEENPQDVGKATDGDPATSWTTMTYRGNPALGGLKPGVGLMLDLGRDQRARSVTVQFVGEPTSFDVYAAAPGVTSSPDSLDQLDKVASRSDAPTKVTVRLRPQPTTRYLLVWLTKLPAAGGGYRGEISGLTVRS